MSAPPHLPPKSDRLISCFQLLNQAIWTAFADVVLFVHQIRSPVAIESSMSHMSLLRELLSRSKNDSANHKVMRPASATPLGADHPLSASSTAH